MRMRLYKNVCAVSWNDDDIWQHSTKVNSLGLYDGNTKKAIAGGEYYCCLPWMPNNYNHCWTGRGLRQLDNDSAAPIDLSAYGTQIPIFGGYVDSHMGHFFIEVLARGIDFNIYRSNPIIFLLLRTYRADRKTFFKYCKFFGLDEERIVILDAPALIPKLYVSRPQFYITHERIKRIGPSQYAYENQALSPAHMPAECFSDQFLEIYRKKGEQLAPEENTIDKILYLSCVKTKNYFGEYIIHKVLEDNEHTVICPEEHSWESVISLVRQHKHIVGMRGSAMHFLLFCRKKKKVTYYGSRPILQHNFYNLEQMMQNDAAYIEVRVDGIANFPNKRNLFRYNDMIKLLEKLGITSVPDHYKDYYQNNIVPTALRGDVPPV